MRIAALLPCEGAVTDGRGAHTLVGVNMNVRHASEFPALLGTHLYVLIENSGEGDPSPGTRVFVRVSVIAPDGSRNRVARGEVEIGQPLYPELPGNIQVALPISFEADEPGTYQLECEVTNEHAAIAQSTNIYVTQQRPQQR